MDEHLIPVAEVVKRYGTSLEHVRFIIAILSNYHM